MLPPDLANASYRQKIGDYHLGEAIAITTYSALFNVNPKFTDPQIVLLDDAHAGEDYVADLWAPRITRADHEATFKAVVGLFQKHIDPWFRRALLSDQVPGADVRGKVEMLPMPKVFPVVGALVDLLEEQLAGHSQRFPWSMVRGALQACNVYVGWNQILIRPLSPPTMLHAPFAAAKQRIYMSATLGAGGELERITGVRDIARIPVPKQWERHSAGRRLFLFPNRSMQDLDIDILRSKAIYQAGRGLVLTPRGDIAKDVVERLEADKLTVFTAKHIEESVDPFIKTKDAALVLTNRYDGIDLPGEMCRMLAIEGLPAGVNLQEWFLLTRLGASSLLRDRLRTRFTQGVGRCSRGPNDYAAVLVLGHQLFEFCAKPENRSGMHPELQAELEFGLDNSDDLSIVSAIDLMEFFYKQGKDWQAADEDIRSRREGKARADDAVATKLAAVVKAEVDYVYSLWAADFQHALERALP